MVCQKKMTDFKRINEPVRFTDCFSNLKDPRRIIKGNYLYPFNEILFLTISSVVSGCQTWEDVHYFGCEKLSWLRKFFPYKNGIPSHDVINRLFNGIDSKAFNHCFMEWVNSISDLCEGRVIPIDGKTIRGAASSNVFSKLHIVSAFCTKNNICIGQKTVSEKSNEITAIPELLDLLAIKGCIITIDAMGCQTNIASKIIEKKADYILMVKNNQEELKQQIEKVFRMSDSMGTDQQNSFGHGRIEDRKCDIISDLKFLDGSEKWKNLHTIIRIQAQRIHKKNGETSTETRYYISSLKSDAKAFNEAVRSHWAIENKLHWVLDVAMNEDNQLKRKGYAAENFNIIRKIALGMIEKENEWTAPKKRKMLKALMNDQYREKLLKV